MGIDRILNDFDRRMGEKKRAEEKKRTDERQRVHEEAMRKAGRNVERFSRLSNAQKQQVAQDVLQPTGRTRDTFFNKYGYLPDVHGDPGSPGFEERRAKDWKMAQERKHNAKLKKYY